MGDRCPLPLATTSSKWDPDQDSQPKFDWLAANFPFIDWRQIVLCGDKSIIRAEYMIDGNVYHLRRFEGEKMLFDSPHNRKVPDAVHRVHNWDEVLSFFSAQGVLPCS